MFKYILLPVDVPISIPVEMTKFKCLILNERDVGEQYRTEVSETLVKAGCVLASAWGLNCSAWDDDVDYAFLDHYDFDQCPEDQCVMTTWHDNETLEEIVEFVKLYNGYSDVKLDDILVLDFATQDRGEFIEKLYKSR